MCRGTFANMEPSWFQLEPYRLALCKPIRQDSMWEWFPMSQDGTTEILVRLSRLDDRISELTDMVVKQRTVKEWYTTAEVAEVLDRNEFTVREWCRHRRIRAEKR